MSQTSGPGQDLHVFRSPQLWPQYPYLRVERRNADRPGMALCYLVADSETHVDPIVYIGPTWPPPEDFTKEGATIFAYVNFDDMQKAGWRVVYMTA